MSKMTTLVGPPRDRGMLDRIRARVTAVATSPSASTCAVNRCNHASASSMMVLKALLTPLHPDKTDAQAQGLLCDEQGHPALLHVKR